MNIEEVRIGFWTEAKTALIPDAQNTVDLLIQSNGAIVNGPHGIGKTFLFIPALKDIAISRGMSLELGFLELDLIRDNSWREELEDYTFDTPTEGRRILVLDEAGRYLATDTTILEGAIKVFRDMDISPIIINAGTTSEERKAVSSQLEDASQEFDFRFLTYELTTTHLPAELVLKYLDRWGVKQDLRDFLSQPENSAFLTTRALSNLYDNLIPDQELSRVRKIRDLQQLRDFMQVGDPTPEWKNWLLKRIGNSRKSMLKGLTNLGILDSIGLARSETIGIDYN